MKVREQNNLESKKKGSVTTEAEIDNLKAEKQVFEKTKRLCDSLRYK